MTIYKIRFSEKGTSIDYANEHGDDFNLRTDDLPLDDFRDAIQSLEEPLRKICNISNPNITVRGITFSEKQNKEIFTISGTTKVALSNSPFNINSPNVFNVLSELDDLVPNLSSDILAIKGYAEKFVNGERRKQEKLFKEPKKKKGKKNDSED